MLSLNLERTWIRVALFCGAMLLVGIYLTFGLFRFVTSVIADPRNQVEVQFLESAAALFPNSAPLQARLAAKLLAAGSTETESYEAYVDRALAHANAAASLAPHSYEAHVLRSAALEYKGDLDAAEAALREAVRLSPNRVDLRWRLANLLIRKDRLTEALAEARYVADAEPRRLPEILNLVRQASDGSLEALEAVTAATPPAQLALAAFLALHEQDELAVAHFTRIDRRALAGLPESGRLIDSLTQAGRYSAAAAMWAHLHGVAEMSGIRNGGFEDPLRQGFNQFDWKLGQTKFADIGITSKQAHDGQRALLVIFRGIDTTKLRDEIQQLVLVEPGKGYRLKAYVKTQDLMTTEGPRLVVLRADNGNTMAESAPIAAGSSDWQEIAVEFTAPEILSAVRIGLQQMPKFSYSKPTIGVVLLDDFDLKRIN